MPKITQIDRHAAKLLHERFNAALVASPELQKLCAEFGLKLEPGRASYNGSNEIKITATLKLEGVLDPMFVQIANMSGFDPSKPSAKDGSRLVGYAGRGKLPWKFERADGTPMKCGDAYAKLHWPLAEDAKRPALTEVDNLIERAS